MIWVLAALWTRASPFNIQLFLLSVYSLVLAVPPSITMLAMVKTVFYFSSIQFNSHCLSYFNTSYFPLSLPVSSPFSPSSCLVLLLISSHPSNLLLTAFLPHPSHPPFPLSVSKLHHNVIYSLSCHSSFSLSTLLLSSPLIL